MFFHFVRLYDMSRYTARAGHPYKDHPLYKLRLATIITAVVGLILNFIAIGIVVNSNNYGIPPFVPSSILLCISFIFVNHDVFSYALERTTHIATQSIRQATLNSGSIPPNLLRPVPAPDDPKPDWPSKRLVVTDLILAIIFQILFWIEFFAIIFMGHSYYYQGGPETWEAYANLANFVASILHAIAFWKELMARKHSSWQRRLEAHPCDNCGHVNLAPHEPYTAPSATRDTVGPNEGEPGPSCLSNLGGIGKNKIILPKWARGPNAVQYANDEERTIGVDGVDRRDDEPLLVTPDESTVEVGGPSGSGQGYGTLDQSVERIPETVVKKKEKGKKRVVEVE